MYHHTIWKLDAVAADFHAMGMMQKKNSAFLIAGQFQQDLVRHSPYKTGRRFLHAQWCWALGHIGLLYQVIRWFKKNEPKTQLVLEAPAATNPYFLRALSPFITIYSRLPQDMIEEATNNAVYFGCPDGIHNLVNFYKMIEQECSEINLLELNDAEHEELGEFRAQLGISGKPYVALQARAHTHDPLRNVNVEQIEDALLPFVSRGFAVVSTGLDPHPINSKYPSVMNLQDARKASFLLSAGCDQFIGSNSGAWTIAHAYKRPVIIMNDWERSAWIYR